MDVPILRMCIRGALEIGQVNVAAFLALDKPNGSIKQARIVMGAVSPVPLKARIAEQALVGKAPDETLFIRWESWRLGRVSQLMILGVRRGVQKRNS